MQMKSFCREASTNLSNSASLSLSWNLDTLYKIVLNVLFQKFTVTLESSFSRMGSCSRLKIFDNDRPVTSHSQYARFLLNFNVGTK